MAPSSDLRTRPLRASVWLEEAPAARRRTPAAVPQQAREAGGGLDRERITATSVRLLDADGLAGFSMRRLAAELGVTAMSVYWYVQGKDDLLELALDAVEGELELPDPADTDADWRDQLRRLAYGYRRMFNEHPWAAGVVGSYLNIGPRALEFAEATRRIMARSGLPPERRSGGIAALFQFVYGFSTVEAHWRSRCRQAGLTTDEYRAAVQHRLSGALETEESRERDFATALDCIIAGLDADAPPEDRP